LVLMFLKVRFEANNLGLVFFGLHCLGVGYLVVRSTFLPRIIGALMLLAGFGWLTFLLPPLAQSLAPFNMLPGAVGELSLTLWLLIKGVNVPRWHETEEKFCRASVPDAGPQKAPSHRDGLQLSR
jgi:hypothetical protein